MKQENPPWAHPAVRDVDGGGAARQAAFGKPSETVGLQSYGN